MSREEFLIQFKALAEKAKDSDDETVRMSSAVMYGLLGSIHAGDEFFQPFVDNVMIVVENQMRLAKTLIERK